MPARDAIFGEYGQARMIRTRDWKYVHRANGGPHELYDLRNDPDETKNLIDSPEHRELRIKLRTELLDWFGRYGEAGADPVGQEYLRPEG
jgi:arylsulfatase A-like enzyme